MPVTNLRGLREKYYKEIKKRALSFELNLSQELRRYQKDQKKLARRNFQLSDTQELLDKAKDSKYIFIGDFHTFEQYQKNALRFLKLLLKKKKKVCLALEMVSSDNQYFIDAYLNRQLTELEFLESIDYYETWRFPWSHYRHLFQLALDFNLPIIALNSEGNLSARDEHAANILANHSQEFKNYSYVTIFGELHILPDNLPNKLNSKLEDNKKDQDLIIHQNLDDVFWKIYDKPVNEDHIIKFNNREYSINSSPPWLKYESVVYWFEHLMDDPAFDLHQYIMQTGLKTFGSNANDNFLNLSTELNDLFKLNLSNDAIEDFDLHDHRKLDYLTEQAESSSPTKSLLTLYTSLLNQNISFKFYHNNDYYCSDYNLNRLTALAGIHLFHQVHLSLNPDYPSSLFLRRSSSIEKFLFLTAEKMFSYLCSKMFNPYIKCDLYKNFTHSRYPQMGKKAIEILDSPEDSAELLKNLNLTQIYLISRMIGEFMGEMFYQRISHRESRTYRISQTFFDIPYRLDHFIQLKKLLLPTAIYKMQRKRKF